MPIRFVEGDLDIGDGCDGPPLVMTLGIECDHLVIQTARGEVDLSADARRDRRGYFVDINRKGSSIPMQCTWPDAKRLGGLRDGGG